jgi:hypothetical protein
MYSNQREGVSKEVQSGLIEGWVQKWSFLWGTGSLYVRSEVMRKDALSQRQYFQKRSGTVTVGHFQDLL